MTSTRPKDPHRALPPATKVLGVAAGGALGGSLRALLIEVFPVGPGDFPWVVFVENVTGAFALGFLLTVLMARWQRAWDLRPFLCTGVLGSFTTFSNLSLGIVELGRAGTWLLSVAYAFGSLLAGIVAAVLGIAGARVLVGGPSS